MGKIANHQSLAFSERGQLSQAFHVERVLNEVNANRAVRIAMQL